MKEVVTTAETPSFGRTESDETFDEICERVRIMHAQRSRFIDFISFCLMDESTSFKIASPSVGVLVEVCESKIRSGNRVKSDSQWFCRVEGNKVVDRGGLIFNPVPKASVFCEVKQRSSMILMHLCNSLMLLKPVFFFVRCGFVVKKLLSYDGGFTNGGQRKILR